MTRISPMKLIELIEILMLLIVWTAGWLFISVIGTFIPTVSIPTMIGLAMFGAETSFLLYCCWEIARWLMANSTTPRVPVARLTASNLTERWSRFRFWKRLRKDTDMEVT